MVKLLNFLLLLRRLFVDAEWRFLLRGKHRTTLSLTQMDDYFGFR